MNDRIKKAVNAMLRDSTFDRKASRTADPRRNSDRVSVGAAYLVQLCDAIRDVPRATRGLPWTVEQAKRRKDKEGFVKFVVPMSLDDLRVGIDCLNDVVSGMVTGETGFLEDVSYRPVGIDGSDVLVEVTGYVDEWIRRHEEQGGGR